MYVCVHMRICMCECVEHVCTGMFMCMCACGGWGGGGEFAGQGDLGIT